MQNKILSYIKTLYNKDKFAFFSLIFLFLLFFTSSTTFLIFGVILTTIYFTRSKYIHQQLDKIIDKSKLSPKIAKISNTLVSFGWGFITSLFFFTLVSFASPAQPSTTPKQEVVKEVKVEDSESKRKLEEEKKNREEADKLAKEQTEKLKKVEQEKKDLEDKLAQATKINTNYDVESNLEEQKAEEAVSANKSIAKLGLNTQNQKLFDVINVVDGDTIKVSELGTLRLIGMDTPETKDPRKPVQCFGKEASNRAKELLSGKKIYLEFDPANRIDKYNRTLAYAYREDGYFYNKEMVKDGFAHSYTKFPHPKLDEFNQAQKEARENNRGFWGESTCNGDTTKAADKASVNNKAPTSTPAKSVAPRSSQPVAPKPATIPAVDTSSNCNPSYPDVCLPASGPDLDCKDVPKKNIKVLPPDPYRLDGNNKDGIGCEG